MKKALAFVLALLSLPLLFSCGKEQQPEASQEVLPSPTVAASEEPSSDPTVYYSPTTGTAYDAPPEYKPMSVMIENQSQARPQTGLQQADIIYEAMAEGDITRFMCIFNDQKPSVAGPIRSARLYYINVQKEWDSPSIQISARLTRSSTTTRPITASSSPSAMRPAIPAKPWIPSACPM